MFMNFCYLQVGVVLNPHKYQISGVLLYKSLYKKLYFYHKV